MPSEMLRASTGANGEALGSAQRQKQHPEYTLDRSDAQAWTPGATVRDPDLVARMRRHLVLDYIAERAEVIDWRWAALINHARGGDLGGVRYAVRTIVPTVKAIVKALNELAETAPAADGGGAE